MYGGIVHQSGQGDWNGIEKRIKGDKSSVDDVVNTSQTTRAENRLEEGRITVG